MASLLLQRSNEFGPLVALDSTKLSEERKKVFSEFLTVRPRLSLSSQKRRLRKGVCCLKPFSSEWPSTKRCQAAEQRHSLRLRDSSVARRALSTQGAAGRRSGAGEFAVEGLVENPQGQGLT